MSDYMGALDGAARADARDRLGYLREQLRAESISYGELAELRDLAPYIESGDVELLEPAGIPEAYAYAPNPYEAAFPYGDDSLHCDYCDVIENAGDLDMSNWNGDTGNHLSCEANIRAHRAGDGIDHRSAFRSNRIVGGVGIEA